MPVTEEQLARMYDVQGKKNRQSYINKYTNQSSRFQNLPIAEENSLPEVVVRPDGTTLNNLKKVLPDKNTRHDFYNYYSKIDVPETLVAQRLYKLWNQAGRPTQEGAGILNLAMLDGSRANYNPITNTIHNPQGNFSFYRDELMHALQFNDKGLNRFKLKLNFPGMVGNIWQYGLGDKKYTAPDGRTLNDKGKPLTNYDNPKSFEYKAHNTIRGAYDKYMTSHDNSIGEYKNFLWNGAGGIRALGGNLYGDGEPLMFEANKFETGGPKKKSNTLPEVIITPDSDYNQFLNTLPDNQRLTPNEEYDTYLYWKLHGKPKDFQEAKDKEMYHWNEYNKSYHANSIAWGDDGVGYFMKPKNHPTVHRETDHYNKGLIYEEDGTARQETPEEKAEFDDFRNSYKLVDDPDRPNYYKYEPNEHADGGELNRYKEWKNLSVKEKADMMKVFIRNGITDLQEIRDKYNEFAEGGNLYVKGGYIYDILPQLFAMDGIRTVLYSGSRPNAVVYQNGKPTNKVSNHARGLAADLGPGKGFTFADMFRVIRNPNSHVGRWMAENGVRYIDETSATGTTKYWHDHSRDHSHLHFDWKGHKKGPISQYIPRFPGASTHPQSIYASNGWREIAKQNIMKHEGFRQFSYADAPKGKSWRSVGYGFNDSGFYSKYPMGISKYYDSKGGITRAEAAQELDYMLNNMENHARRAYGSKWDQFNDNQKAAIMDTMYQRPASVLKGSQFYKAVMAGDPNAGNYLGVKGYERRNADRRGLFGAAVTNQQYPMQQPMQMQQVDQFAGWQPSNMEAFYGMAQQNKEFAEMAANFNTFMDKYNKQQEMEAKEAERQAKLAEKQRGLQNLAFFMGMNQDENSSSPYMGVFNMLANNALTQDENAAAYGGKLYDGITQPTQQMNTDDRNWYVGQSIGDLGTGDSGTLIGTDSGGQPIAHYTLNKEGNPTDYYATVLPTFNLEGPTVIGQSKKEEKPSLASPIETQAENRTNRALDYAPFVGAFNRFRQGNWGRGLFNLASDVANTVVPAPIGPLLKGAYGYLKDVSTYPVRLTRTMQAGFGNPFDDFNAFVEDATYELNPFNKESIYTNDAGDAFLLDPYRQRKFMENLGYFQTTDDDGVNKIRKATEGLLKDRHQKTIPIYQMEKDAIPRDSVYPISEEDMMQKLNEMAPKGTTPHYLETGYGLNHAGEYPLIFYADKNNPSKFYYRAIDLNDYGNHTGNLDWDQYNAEHFGREMANMYDMIGTPFIQKTGILPLKIEYYK